MSEETQKTDSAKQATRNPVVLCGIVVDDLPPAPWTYKALGRNTYYAVATAGGYLTGQEPATYTPDLDPRSFAQGVAWKQLQERLTIDARLTLSERHQIITDLLANKLADDELAKHCPAQSIASLKAVVDEAAQLQSALQKQFGAAQGTPRNPTAVAFAEQRNKQR